MTKHCYLRTLICISIMLICSFGVFANEYKYSGDDTSWETSVSMTESSGGAYEYYGPTSTTWHEFIIQPMDGSATYGYSYVSEYFNSTDMAVGQYASHGCVENPGSVSYYIIIWKPNTIFNNSGSPVICASTILPADNTLFSAQAITTSDVAVPHNSNLTIPSTAAMITGGNMVIYNRYVSADDDLTPIRPSFGPKGDKRPAFYLSGGSVSFQVNISDNTLEEGDVIYAKIYARANPIDGNGLWFSTSTTRPGSAPAEKAVASSAAGSAWTSVSYTVTSSDALHGVSSFYIYLGQRDQGKTTIVFTDFVIARPAAPTAVTISGTNKYLGGQTISLTATPTGGSGTLTYQWQKKLDDEWTNLSNGTVDGVTFSGATSNNLQISPCGHGNSGGYRCVVSSGPSSSKKSHEDNTNGYGVHVFSIKGGYYGNSWSQHDITWTSGTTGTATIHLNASSTFMFKVFSNHGYYYGNGSNNYIIQPINWDCGIENQDIRLFTGPEGDYTFTVNIEHGLDGSPYVNVQVAYPNVVHPSPGYIYITKWWPTCYVHYWEGTDNALSPWGSDPAINSDRYATVCGTDYWYFPVIDTYNKFIAKNKAGDPTDGRTTGNQETTDHGGMYITHDGSWGWHDFSCLVDLPGTVDKGNVNDYISTMTWYGANDEYFDFGPGDNPNTDRWAEWKVNLLYSGKYSITEDFDVPWHDNNDGTGFWTGHQWRLCLLNANGDTISAYSTTRVSVQGGERTDATQWDLSAISPGVYTLHVTNQYRWAQPKLKSITLSYCVPKVPNQEHYGDPGDAMRAYGTITNSIVTTLDQIPSGAISASGRELTIGSETITAPETSSGTLTDIPKDCYDPDPEKSCPHVSSCLWRFKEWNTTELKAIYIPTFAIGYDPKGGTINDDPYNTWYEYTGREEDITELPMDVTKEGYLFAGWYQDESTKELFPYITGNYYGDYSGAYGLKAHWVLPCDEQKVITGVTLTSSSSYTTDGYDPEYIGTPLVTITGSDSESANVDGVAGDETGYKLGATGDMVFVTLGTGIFRVGDMIRVYITAQNTAGLSGGSRDYLELFYKTKAGDIVLLTHLKNVNAAGVYSYILPSDDVSDMTDAEAVSVGVYRKDGADGQNPCVYRVEVVGCRDLYFDDNNNSHNWSDPKNWAPTYHEIPSYYQAVRILKPCIVNIANAQAKNVELYKDAGKNYNGQLTINDTAALAVEETIRETRGTDDFETLYPVQASDLVILSTASHQGALAHGDTENKTRATVEFYARGVVDINDWEHGTWQYMGVPFNDVTDAQEHYYGAWMAQWIEDTSGDINANWTWIAQYDALTPFAGYGLTQKAAKIYTNSGTLVPSSNQTLTLTASGSDYKGWNMFANSWMAPIHITQFIAADFGAAEQTIYLFNTGHNKGNQSTFDATTSAGQYIAVPINTAGSMDASYQYVAPMQGFYILTESATSVTLNYDRLVRKSDHSALSVGPNRAPRRATEEETTMPRIIIDVKGSRFSDRLYIFENEEQTNGFDNGWDGHKFEGDDYAPQLMTRTGDLDLAVDVSPSFGGKRIAFRVGEDTEYTLHFSSTENGLWIRDLITDYETEIAEENTYSFSASNTTSEERFEIIDRRQAEEVTTGFSEIGEYEGELIAQTVYTIDGRLVLKRTTDFNQPLRLPQTGVYILELQTTAGVKIKKITF